MVFSEIAKSCPLKDFYHLVIVPGGLGSHCSLPEFNSPSSIFAMKEFGDFYKNV
jgi:hypothetical protein